MVYKPYLSLLSSLLARLDEAAIDQQFGDLNGVQGCTLAQVVGDDPDVEAVLDGRILADTGDVGRVFAGRFVRRHVAAGLMLVDDDATGGFAQDVAGLV